MTTPSLELAGLRTINLLLVEDNPGDVDLCLRELRQGGLDVRADVVQTGHEFCVRISEKPYHVILADYTLPTCNGLEVLELLQQMDVDIPFILITGTMDDLSAAECLRRGASDYVQKDRLARLPVAVERAVEMKFLRDERRRIEQRLRRLEKRYARLAELSPEPLFIQEMDRLVFLNAAAAKLLGANQPEDLMGQPVFSIVHPDHQAGFRQRLERLNGNAEPVCFEQKLVRLDGKTVDVRVAALGLEGGERRSVQLVVHDISERKRVEEAIKSLAAFAQFNPNPVLEFCRDGRLTYYNEAAQRMAASLSKADPSAVVPADIKMIVQRCCATNREVSLETSLVGRTFAWLFFPIAPNQVVHCYVTDITDRINLEGQLRHSQKMESVGRLAAGVAHDFNNILTVIQGHTGLLRHDSNLGVEMVESLQQVSRAAERASKLTNQLLAFSRKSVMQLRRLDLNDVLTNISAMLYRTLGEDITFQFNYEPDLPSVHADLSMMEQVIMNLAVNARDAMPQGGQLIITTRVVDLDQACAERCPEARLGRFVSLSMTDTGHGMDHVTLSRLFEPFFTTKEFGKGTGLGLATVYGIIKQHQGWIEVRSQPGQGATFTLYLPLCEAEAQAAPEREDDAAVIPGHETILVVEDEAPVRLTTRNILERYGYRVLEAANGVEALAVWHQSQQEIALLLTDLVMPVGLSGQELAEKFTAQKPGLKVVYTSGYSVDVAGKGLDQVEGLHFLEKPFDARRLAHKVRECLDTGVPCPTAPC